MLGPGGRSRAKSEINVTPLIDVVLVLLIVFIVLLPGLTRSLPVALPRVVRTSAPPPTDPRDPPLVLVLDGQGGLALQGGRIELGRLAGALVPVVLRQPAGLRRVVLRIDGGLPWQRVVAVLDQVRVASEAVRKQTAGQAGPGGEDGGDIKVAMQLEPGT
jgi:biopolymer transport protein ExbD